MNAGNASSNNAANQTFYDSFKKNEQLAFKKQMTIVIKLKV